eukprot:355756-Pelagomonas_calceolata.AAC.2
MYAPTAPQDQVSIMTMHCNYTEPDPFSTIGTSFKLHAFHLPPPHPNSPNTQNGGQNPSKRRKELLKHRTPDSKHHPLAHIHGTSILKCRETSVMKLAGETTANNAINALYYYGATHIGAWRICPAKRKDMI